MSRTVRHQIKRTMIAVIVSDETVYCNVIETYCRASLACHHYYVNGGVTPTHTIMMA